MIMIIVLFFATASSGIFDIEAEDDGDNRWWDLDLKREERAALKIVFNMCFLLIACGTLFVPMKRVWHPSKGVCDRFNLGVLAASTLLVSCMFFVSFWYSLNFGQQEEDENDENNGNGNDDNNDDDREMDEEELLAYERKVVSSVSIVLAMAFSILSAWIYVVGKKLPETGHSNDETQVQAAKAAAHMEILSELWTLLSSVTITIFVILFIASIVLSRGEEAERMREEGAIINLITVLLWMVIVTTGIFILGRKILGEKKLNGTLGVGMLSGGTMYFSLLLFMVFILYANPTFEERRKEDGAGSASATAAACFFLSLMYLVFSLGTCKYQTSIISALSMSEKDDESSAADFKRMDDGEPENRPGIELS
ncbi:hypothetical protein ACHAXR_006672 [Thalassiosira sp. AJA248-18]